MIGKTQLIRARAFAISPGFSNSDDASVNQSRTADPIIYRWLIAALTTNLDEECDVVSTSDPMYSTSYLLNTIPVILELYLERDESCHGSNLSLITQYGK